MSSRHAVYVFVPNLIGYLRIATAVWAFWIARTDPMLTLGLYITSFVLDAADGMAARALDQCSRFGAILDMIIDRAATSAFLVMVVAVGGPQFAFPVALTIGLDIVSHFARMYTQSVLGASSHKDTSTCHYWFLSKYYSSRTFMGTFCVGQEGFYLWLYWALFQPELAAPLKQFDVLAVPEPQKFFGLALLALWAGKQLANVQQLLDAMQHLADVDVKDRAAAKAKVGAKGEKK